VQFIGYSITEFFFHLPKVSAFGNGALGIVYEVKLEPDYQQLEAAFQNGVRGYRACICRRLFILLSKKEQFQVTLETIESSSKALRSLATQDIQTSLCVGGLFIG
jgi:hypothetical protein